MKNKTVSTTLKLPIALVTKCQATYNTANTSEAIFNALTDFLLLPFKKQEINDFALHQIVPDIEDRRNVRSFSIRIPEMMLQIIKGLSDSRSNSSTVSQMVSQALYMKSQPTDAMMPNELLYVLGNKRNPKMQAAIKNIQKTAKKVSWETSVETCAGGLGIYANFKFAEDEILNDADWRKVNLYKAIQENPRELIMRARVLNVDKATFDKQRETLKTVKASTKVNYEAAASYLYLNLNSYRGTGITLDNAASDARYCKALSAIMPLHQRLSTASDKKATMLYNLDIFRIIERYRKQTDVLFIIDPPYLNADVYNKKENEFGQKEHERLANLLRLVKQHNKNDFLYFCRITAPRKYQNEPNAAEYNNHMKCCIDDLYYGHGFYYTDVVLNDTTTERIITSFDFDGAIPYGCERGQK